MYESFFALHKAPFSVVPDPDCIHLTAEHADAINGLAFGVLERKGYLLLTADPGLGKTTALRALTLLLSDSGAKASTIFVPTLTAPEFLEMVLINFGFREVPASKAQRLKLLEDFLLRCASENRAAALIVDEAHQLSPDLLEEIRLLGNFETVDSKLLQIVLVGQNQLNDQLNLPQLWQLKQRITLRFSLSQLGREAVEEYIRYRWAYAGGTDPLPFSPAAVDAIAVSSMGIPRVINVICDNALLIAFSQTSRNVDDRAIREACQELSLPAPPPVSLRPPSVDSLALTPIVEQQPAIEPVGSRQIESPLDEWPAVRPSLFDRLIRRSPSARTRSRTGILSLREP